MNRTTFLTLFIIALLFLPVRRAAADIYQFVDSQGVVHFSNVSIGKESRRVSREVRRSHEPQRTHHSRPAAAVARQTPKAYIDIINDACDRHGVDPELVHAVVKVESDYNPRALSRKGAMGLMQLMPETAAEMNVSDIFDPGDNIDGGVKYLKYLIDRYAGNLSLALAAYNSGETAVKKWGTVPPYPETQRYVQKVLTLYNGTGVPATPSYTIYVGHSNDGALVFTDDPSKYPGAKLKRNLRNL